MNDMSRVLILIEGASVFGLLFCVWLVGVLLWSRRRLARDRRVEQRLKGLKEMDNTQSARVLRLWHGGQEAVTAVPVHKKRRSPLANLRQLHRDAGFETSIATLLLGLLGMAAFTFLIVTTLSGNTLMAGGSVALLLCAVWIYVERRVNKLAQLFEQQLVDALGLATRSLRAGYALPAPFRLITEEMTPPITKVFEEITQQNELGVGMEDALEKTAAASTSTDFRLFATAMIIQLRSGGNLADLMDRLCEVIRTRIRLHRRVRILTAQSQFSKRILIALPILLFFLLNVLNPEYMEPLYVTKAGRILVLIAMLMIALGAWMINRIGTLRY